MSSFELEKVVDDVFAVAVWDDSWDSYNNCYIVVEDSDCILMDSGKREHAVALIEALAQLDRTSEDVTAVLMTHGHRDHVGGSLTFPKARKYLHPLDWGLPTPRTAGVFTALPDQGTVLGFECVLLGRHTVGSVAFYHPATKVLFSGDHVCFFGAPLLQEGLVGKGVDRRERFRAFVAEWARHWPPNKEEAERLAADLQQRPPEDLRRHDFELFLAGLARLPRFEASALCTGHGPVLVEEIPQFIDELVAAAQRS